MKRNQHGYIGKGLADAMAFAFVIVAIVSALGGWALIEGIIWICKHLTIGWAA